MQMQEQPLRVMIFFKPQMRTDRHGSAWPLPSFCHGLAYDRVDTGRPPAHCRDTRCVL